MSRPVVLLLDCTEVHRLPTGAESTSNVPAGGRANTSANASATATGALESVSWRFDASVPDMVQALAPLRGAAGARSELVVVLGLGLLDIAQPELPPVGNAARHALLSRDADRYFPIDGRAAVALSHPFAFAASSERFGAWMQALASVGRVRAVITIADALVRAGANGSWSVAAGPAELAYITVDAGALKDVRRRRVATTEVATTREAATDEARRAPASFVHVARGAVQSLDAPLDTMLLDETLAARLAGARRLRLLQRVAAGVLIVVALAWSADRWRARELMVADAELARLTRDAAPAQAAALRLSRAREEIGLLRPAARASVAAVLARLGAVLPRDAFVQRLDWDGSVWTIDGSAANAPAIVPLLDGDAMFSDVRIIAATTRFIDLGKQRESFSISFRTREGGGANGTP